MARHHHPERYHEQDADDEDYGRYRLGMRRRAVLLLLVTLTSVACAPPTFENEVVFAEQNFEVSDMATIPGAERVRFSIDSGGGDYLAFRPGKITQSYMLDEGATVDDVLTTLIDLLVDDGWEIGEQTSEAVGTFVREAGDAHYLADVTTIDQNISLAIRVFPEGRPPLQDE